MSDPFTRYLSSGLQHEKPEPTADSEPVKREPADQDFYEELKSLINRHSKENGSGTPDHILASFLSDQLELFDRTLRQRASWRGERLDAPFAVKYDSTVKIAAYDEHGRGNEIGEAEVTIWPGETMRYGRLTGLKAIFASPETPKESDANNG